MVNISQFPVAS